MPDRSKPVVSIDVFESCAPKSDCPLERLKSMTAFLVNAPSFPSILPGPKFEVSRKTWRRVAFSICLRSRWVWAAFPLATPNITARQITIHTQGLTLHESRRQSSAVVNISNRGGGKSLRHASNRPRSKRMTRHAVLQSKNLYAAAKKRLTGSEARSRAGDTGIRHRASEAPLACRPIPAGS